MGYAKQYLNYESIDIYGAQEAVKAIRNDRRVFSTTATQLNKECSNGFLIASAEIESEANRNQHAISIVLQSISNFFEKKQHGDPLGALKDSILQANRQLFFMASHNENLKGITLSVLVALIQEKQFYYAYVGNNNLFHASEGKVKRLTPGISQVEGEEEEVEIPLVNSSLIDSDMSINVSDGPVTPEHGDYFFVCPKSFVYTSDDFVKEALSMNENMDNIARKILNEALSLRNNVSKTFSLVKMNLIGGKGVDADDVSRMYGGILSKIIVFMTSPFALLGMAVFIVVLLLILFGLM